VKEQLKKMGSFEYYHTSFSYTRTTRPARSASSGCPSRAAATSSRPTRWPRAPSTPPASRLDGTVGLYRSRSRSRQGTGKLKLAGGVAGAMKESVQRAFSYLQSKKSDLGVARDLDTSDLHVEVIDLLGNRVEAELGVAFFVAAYSALRKAPVSPRSSSSAT
jgi:ATP-dependent Lon protease